MAEKISEYVDSPVVPTTYPNGKLLDESAPGANDGTLLRNVHVQDMWNVFAKAMDDTGTVFDTNPDTQTSSQFFEALAASMHPVGATIQSALTVAQFNAQPGFDVTKWVLADGRLVTGSRYEDITLLANVPDTRGRYLRSSATADASLRATQAGQMGTHNHTLSHNHGLVAGYAMITPTTLSSGTMNTRYTPFGTQNAYTYTNQRRMDGTSAIVDVTSGTATPTKLGGNTDGASNSTTSSITTGSTETRPDSIIFNTFIKIN